MQLILILPFSVRMCFSRYVLYLACLSNELTLAVSGVTDVTSRLPSIPVLTSSSPSFPVPHLWHLILQSLCCKGDLNKFNPFSDSQGRIWMDLTLELFLMQPCSVLAAAMLDSKDPLLPWLVSQGQDHWLKLVTYFVGRIETERYSTLGIRPGGKK